MVIKVKDVDPRVKRTRQLLQQAFLELLQEKSFQAITVQDITERATVNRATFYAHYEDKYALLDGYIREHFQQMVSSKLPTSSPLSVSSLRMLILAVFDYLAQVRGHECKPTNRQVDPLFEMTVQQELYELLLSWLKQTPSPASRRVPVEITAMVTSWAIFGAGVQWSRGTRTPSIEEIADHILIVITGSLERALQVPLKE
ncbi:MAG: TetR/AcrR family transcriptional regulator [Ktedonobacteraceae bacterium]|jgi:AcrR family transcriptional regulator